MMGMRACMPELAHDILAVLQSVCPRDSPDALQSNGQLQNKHNQVDRSKMHTIAMKIDKIAKQLAKRDLARFRQK